jgi:hypothetical protein
MEYFREAKWDLIPSHMHEGVRAYVMEGVPAGGFLMALLRNAAFSEVVARADDANQRALLGWAKFLHNEMPAACHGSAGRVETWLAHGGLKGWQKYEEERERA